MRSHAYVKTIVIVAAALSMMAALALLAWPRTGLARAQTPTPPPGAAAASELTRTVSVSGHGEVQATPDQATVTVGVQSQAATAEAALDENNTKMAALLKVIKDAGVASKDIQTSNFSIFPVYEEKNVSNEPPRVIGYRVNNQVVVKVRSLDALGSLLDAVVKAGANQIQGIAFGFADPQALLDQAREQAMKDAQRKATQLATLGNSQLGPVLTISEGGVTPPRVVVERTMVAPAAAPAVPVEAGESTVTVDVQVTYTLR
ncbi:MAG: SIMPL domain-containing protein [Ardenticatenaceae bacterium]|nr:SIMPL domain-containing protein [Ardenticatenaceae bacterium]